MAERKPIKNNTAPKDLTDDSSSDEEVPPQLKTTIEEREYGTIPGSREATIAALSHSRAQANPVVPRGPIRAPRTRKLTKDKSVDKTTQTDKDTLPETEDKK